MVINNGKYFNKPAVRNGLYMFLTAYILLQCFILLFSESTIGFWDIENISYYRAAKYSVKHPELFFTPGESPFYTVLLMPFAWLGYLVARGINIFIAVSTMLMSALIARRIYNGKLIILIVALIAFAPVFFRLSISALPEVLFGFLLMAAVYLFIRKKYLWASFVVSFLPQVSPGGIVLLPVFALAFYLQKSYRAIPALITGSFIYVLAGYFIFDNFSVLLIEKIEDLFQRSERFAFLPLSEIGIVLILLAGTGLVIWIYELLRSNPASRSETVQFGLIAGSLVVYYAFSYLWFSSTRLEFLRSIGAVVPMMALTGFKTVEFIQGKIKAKKVVAGVLLVIVASHVFLMFSKTDLIVQASQREKAIEKAASYLRYNEQGSKLFFYDPLLVHYLQMDPSNSLLFDSRPGKGKSSGKMDWGDILVWDSRIANESIRLKPADLQNDSNLVRIISFGALNDSSGNSNGDYEVHIFKKGISKDLAAEISDSYKSVLNFNGYLDKRVKETDGMKVWELDSTQEYSPSIRVKTGVVHKKNFYEVTAKVCYKVLEQIKAAEVLLVCSVEEDGKSMSYNTAYIVGRSDNWEEQELKFTTQATFPKSANIVVYLWNKERKHILVEELSVAVKSY